MASRMMLVVLALFVSSVASVNENPLLRREEVQDTKPGQAQDATAPADAVEAEPAQAKVEDDAGSSAPESQASTDTTDDGPEAPAPETQPSTSKAEPAQAKVEDDAGSPAPETQASTDTTDDGPEAPAPETQASASNAEPAQAKVEEHQPDAKESDSEDASMLESEEDAQAKAEDEADEALELDEVMHEQKVRASSDARFAVNLTAAEEAEIEQKEDELDLEIMRDGSSNSFD